MVWPELKLNCRTMYKESKTLYDMKKPTLKSRRSTIQVMCELAIFHCSFHSVMIVGRHSSGFFDTGLPMTFWATLPEYVSVQCTSLPTCLFSTRPYPLSTRIW